MTTMLSAAALCVFGLLLLFTGVRRLRRGRFFRAGARSTLGVVFIGSGALVFAVSSNLYTYSRLTFERDIAELEFAELNNEHYTVTFVDLSSGDTQEFGLRGNEWQIDARILKWRGVGNLLGMDASYRLERLSGRYEDVGREVSERRTVHSLSEDSGIDVWSLAKRTERWMPFADAAYGSATYLPMADGAVYQVSITQSGLIARPANDAAKDATRGWD